MVVQPRSRLVEDGAKLRVYTTVVETTSSSDRQTLLWDVVRVVTAHDRAHLAKALEMRRIKGFRDRRSAARRRMCTRFQA